MLFEHRHICTAEEASPTWKHEWVGGVAALMECSHELLVSRKFWSNPWAEWWAGSFYPTYTHAHSWLSSHLWVLGHSHCLMSNFHEKCLGVLSSLWHRAHQTPVGLGKTQLRVSVKKKSYRQLPNWLRANRNKKCLLSLVSGERRLNVCLCFTHSNMSNL